MDTAFKNATARRDVLRSEIAEMEGRIDTARAELSRVESFLAEWARFAGGDVSTPTQRAFQIDSDVSPEAPKRTRPKNPSKEEVGDHVQTLLEEFNSPMSRARLFTELEQRGVRLEGSDPSMVLSTMLWRLKDRFERIPGKGYWIKDRPLPQSEGTQDGEPSRDAA